jgi:Fe-S-cluster containining protein
MSDSTPPDPPPDSPPWYGEGLRFACTQCGNCCSGFPGFVWITPEELSAIADYLGKSTGEVRLMHTRLYAGRLSLSEFANGDCTFFDPKTRGCKIYPARPTQCRTWPFWRSNLESPETWQRTAQNCPGIGRGDFVPLEEIETRAAAREM